MSEFSVARSNEITQSDGALALRAVLRGSERSFRHDNAFAVLEALRSTCQQHCPNEVERGRGRLLQRAELRSTYVRKRGDRRVRPGRGNSLVRR